jgi:beta-N-acetylhexosaminidase
VSRADELLSSMSLREKIGHMVCVRAYNFKEKIPKMLSEGLISGLGAVIITQKGSRDLEPVIGIINEYKKLSKFPLLLYMDAECGIRDMFNFGTIFPSLMALGATRSKELAYKMGYIIGKEASAIGISMASNPVLDINNNPDNPIINTRAFSDNVELVIDLAGEYIKGIQEAGVIPNGKHFPGHGDTDMDSHVAMPVISHSKEYLMKNELLPYKVLIKDGMLGVMTAHIMFPSLVGSNEEGLPATLSRNIITNLLRKELEFDGLIVSDSLAMKGIRDVYGLEKSAVLAVKAGHDIILQDYNSDPDITIDAVVSAAESGELNIEQINESVRRILEIRESLGNLNNQQIDIDMVKKAVGSDENVAVAIEIADKSITVLENRDIPFMPDTNEKVLVIATKTEEEGSVAEDLHSNIVGKSGYMFDECKKYIKNVEFAVINENPDPQEIEELLKLAENYERVVFGTFIRVISYKEGSGSIPAAQAKLIEMLNKTIKKPVIVIFGSPYALKKLPKLNNCIVAYSDCEYSIDAAMKVLFGKLKPEGKLPVTVNDKYINGYGL